MKPDQKCPGESTCLSQGECFQQDTTIEIHCKPDICKLFYTKEGAIPAEFLGLLQAANIFGEKNRCGLEKFELEYPFWAVEAYKSNERTYGKAEAESNAKQSKTGDEDDSLAIDKGGDSDAFGNIEAQFEQKKPLELSP